MNLTKIIHEEYNKILKEQQETKKLKIRSVHGSFICSNNNLTSLEGSPKTVGGAFYCSDNKLTSLQGSPKVVGGFYCANNKVKFTKDDVRNVSYVK